jgi:hypothetical protein
MDVLRSSLTLGRISFRDNKSIHIWSIDSRLESGFHLFDILNGELPKLNELVVASTLEQIFKIDVLV